MSCQALAQVPPHHAPYLPVKRLVSKPSQDSALCSLSQAPGGLHEPQTARGFCSQGQLPGSKGRLTEEAALQIIPTFF